METIIETKTGEINWLSKESFLVKLNREDMEMIVLVDVTSLSSDEFAGTVIHEKETDWCVGEYFTDFHKSRFVKFEGTITIKQ